MTIAEAAAHEALRRVAQELSDTYGLRVTAVRFTWIDRSTVGTPGRGVVGEIELHTSTGGTK
jgi:hypothetical protein